MWWNPENFCFIINFEYLCYLADGDDDDDDGGNSDDGITIEVSYVYSRPTYTSTINNLMQVAWGCALAQLPQTTQFKRVFNVYNVDDNKGSSLMEG